MTTTKGGRGWKPHYGENRKKKYRSDAAFRQSCIIAASERNRQVIWTKPENVAYRDRVRKRALSMAKNCLEYQVIGAGIGQSEAVAGYSITHLAKLLERTPSTLKGWIDAGILPEPNLQTIRGFKIWDLETSQRIVTCFWKYVAGKNSNAAGLSDEALANFASL